MLKIGFLKGKSEKPKTDSPVVISDSAPRPQHKGSAEQQKVIDYAWDISHDRNFIYLLKSENGAITPDRLSLGVGKNGYRDIGYCQMNKGYQADSVKNPHFLEMEWQINKCFELYKNGTTFYGLKKFLNPKNAVQRKQRQSVLDSIQWI